jgi:predicted phosphodiesterase
VKLAILSDIHGNSGALREVLAAADKAGAEHLLILGDLVGYYYDAHGVLALLDGRPAIVIGGNHEQMLGEARASPDASARHRKKYGSALDVALATLDQKQIAWLTGLPKRRTAEFGGLTFELCHGAPDDPDRYVYPTASDEELQRCELPGRIVLMGHTHYPMVSLRSNCTLINCGSVGQARDLGGFAAWMLFDTATGTIVPYRTAYETAGLAAEARARDPGLPYLADILHRNRQTGP